MSNYGENGFNKNKVLNIVYIFHKWNVRKRNEFL